MLNQELSVARQRMEDFVQRNRNYQNYFLLNTQYSLLLAKFYGEDHPSLQNWERDPSMSTS